MKLTLMHQESEVLSFELDVATGAVNDVRPLGRADLAPLGVFGEDGASSAALATFVERRSIPYFRKDLSLILNATSSASACELALRAHGLSLSDQYWYRPEGDATTWSTCNFFDNGWDDAFGRAVLRRDYDALAHADACVPDVTCFGAARKAWVHGAGGAPRLLKSSPRGVGSLFGEALAAQMLARILPPDEFVPYELMRIDGEVYSSCPAVVSRDEDLLTALPFSDKPRVHGVMSDPAEWRQGIWDLLTSTGAANPRQAVAKLAVAEALMFKEDLNPANYGVVRDAAHDSVRLAPLFDLTGAFGTFNKIITGAGTKGRMVAALYVVTRFRELDPTWDYSWLDLSALDGFGEELETGLLSCEELPRDYPALARELFEMQLDYVASVMG